MLHIPVLLKEVIKYLDPEPGKRYIDATIGMGGHAQALAERGAKVFGIDRDPSVVKALAAAGLQFEVVTGNFAQLGRLARNSQFSEVDGIVFDLGMSSHQLDHAARGFSFQKVGPLDMRFDVQGNKTPASKIVNYYPEKELIRIFRDFGEEKRFGRRIAKTILLARKLKNIETTGDLFELIKKSLPGQFRHKAGDTARKIFQSLRIAVNNELDDLQKALPQAVDLLANQGRLVVISFHSLEDRIVKKFFFQAAKNCVCPPSFPICVCGAHASLRILTKKPLTAAPEELEVNPRSRSAKLRVAEKI